MSKRGVNQIGKRLSLPYNYLKKFAIILRRGLSIAIYYPAIFNPQD